MATMTTAAPPPEQASLPCPMCDYDLRGQVEPRCPECGYRFDWDELRDPARRLHPYLFEHHPENNLRSFVRTLIGSLRPGKFWRALLPVQPSRPRRLFAYFVIVGLFALLPAAIHMTHSIASDLSDLRRSRAAAAAWLASPAGAQVMRAHPGMTIQQVLDREVHTPGFGVIILHGLRRETIIIAVVAGLAAVLWPLATLLTMLVFRVSMRRARVRTIHVFRCVVYSADAYVWGGLAFAALTGWLLMKHFGRPWNFNPGTNWEMMAALLGWATYLTLAWRLARSFKLYLRFDHPIATVIATQVIVLLLALNVAQAVHMVFG